jgi:U3 small nucleolar RNA-associated protein 23
VPLVYINRSVMVMEPMAGRSAEVREAEEKGKVRAGLKSRRGAEVSGEKRKIDDGLDGEEAKEADLDASVPKRKKPKGPSGPNPLSVKKAKKPAEEKKSQGRKVEDERSVLRRAAKQDPQAGEKALSAEAALGEGGASADAATEGTSGGKRTRKRKPKEAPSAPTDEAVAAAVRTAISDARYDVD